MRTETARKIEALIARGSTAGERQAAREALARLTRAQYGDDYTPGMIHDAKS